MLGELWYGGVDPNSEVLGNAEYRAAAEDAESIETEISEAETITVQQVKALKVAYSQVSALGREAAFIEGVKLGVKFCFEALSPLS